MRSLQMTAEGPNAWRLQWRVWCVMGGRARRAMFHRGTSPVGPQKTELAAHNSGHVLVKEFAMPDKVAFRSTCCSASASSVPPPPLVKATSKSQINAVPTPTVAWTRP